ncbi:rubredoxin [Neisseria meningitidis]|nr:rubredoxin [Neisseria meningitidis]EOB61770.1 rubredoxin [Neisseria meningitidis 61106]
MAQYMCGPCGWIYDEEHGDPEHGIVKTSPWKCPECGVGKEDFYLLDFVI